MNSNRLNAHTAVASRWVIRIILLLVTVVTLFPLIWNVYSSFKTNTEFLENPFSLPG